MTEARQRVRDWIGKIINDCRTSLCNEADDICLSENYEDLITEALEASTRNYCDPKLEVSAHVKVVSEEEIARADVSYANKFWVQVMPEWAHAKEDFIAGYRAALEKLGVK